MVQKEDTPRRAGQSDAPLPRVPEAGAFAAFSLEQLRPPRCEQPEVLLTRLAKRLMDSAREVSLGRETRGALEMVRALRLAVECPDQTHPLVGESYLQASHLFLQRALRHTPLVVYPHSGMELYDLALKVRTAGHWTDPALDLRFQLLRHQLKHYQPAAQHRSVLTDVSLTLGALNAGTKDPLVAAHLGVIAAGIATRLKESAPLLAIALLQRACLLAASVLGASHPQTSSLRLSHAELNFSRAIELPSSVIRSGELRLVIGSVEKIRDSYLREATPDKTLLGRMECLLAISHMTEGIQDFEQAGASLRTLDRLLSETQKPDGALVKHLLSLASHLYQQERINVIPENHLPPSTYAPAKPGMDFLSPLLERCMTYAENSPNLTREPAYLGYLYLAHSVNLMRHGRFNQVLPSIDKLYSLDLSPLSADRTEALYLDHTTSLYLGHYSRAHNAATTLLELTSCLDPLRIDINEFARTRVKLLGKSIEPELGWGLKLANEVAPLMNMLSNDLQRPIALMFAHLNALAGRLPDLSRWVETFDGHVLTRRNETFSDFISAQIESGEPERYDKQATEKIRAQQEIDLEEITTRCLIELMRETPDLTMIYRAVELFRRLEQSGAAAQISDPRLKASMPLIEGRLWLERKDSEQARACLDLALKPLQYDLPLLRYHQAAILLSIGESYAMERDYGRSSITLKAAQELFECLPDPTIELARVYRGLMLNSEAIGDTADREIYFEAYQETVQGLARMPAIPLPDAIPD